MLSIWLLMYAKKLYMTLPKEDGPEKTRQEHKAITAEDIGTKLLRFCLCAIVIICVGYFIQYGEYHGAVDALQLCGENCNDYTRTNLTQIIGAAESRLTVLHVLLGIIILI